MRNLVEEWRVGGAGGGGGGGKGGGKGGGGRTPVEQPDNLQADSTLYVIDVVSEGEIEGWLDPQHPARNILLDGTPLEAEDGSPNFEGVQWTLRTGLPDQDPVPGFTAVETDVSVGVEVTNETSVARQITNPDLDAVRVTINAPVLSQQRTNGDIVGARVEYRILIQEGVSPARVAVTDALDGKTTSGFSKQWRIDLPEARPVTITVERLTDDNAEATIQDNIFWTAYTELIDAKLSYPDTAYVALAIPAKAVGNRLPARSYRLRGVRVLVPSNYDAAARTYDEAAPWDGTFVRAFSDNPAWCLYEALTNARWGLGERVAPEIVDKFAFYEAAKYCDDLIDDGLGGLEPRFRCNGLVADRSKAYELVTELASLMRATTYWGRGAIVLAQDRPREPVKLVTNANVIDGEFDYATTAASARKTTASGSFRDPADAYALKELVSYDDAEAIARYGFREARVVLNYTISRGEALRTLRWIVDTDQTATETVTYRAGFDHAAVRPGDLIEIADKHRLGFRAGGRLRAVGAGAVTLDSAVALAAGQAYTLTIARPDGAFADYAFTAAASEAAEVIAVAVPAGDAVPGAIWALTAPK
ncbi:MAG: phage tail protein, partial [Pseudomonadota bacterium]